MRKFIIDTDTGSDDAVAIMMALKEREVEVLALTTVAGNVPADYATRNALISIEKSNSYAPPVFKGCSRPIVKPYQSAQEVHGNDGLSDMGYEVKSLKVEDEHGVDAMLRIVAKTDDVEIIALGPLTNIAVAMRQSPEIMKRVKRIFLMGGALIATNQVTPAAEFNIYVDPEAAAIVWEFGVPLTVVPLDVCMPEEAMLNEEGIEKLLAANTEEGEFIVRCNQRMIDNFKSRTGKGAIAMPDQTAVAAALYPELIDESFECFSQVDTRGQYTYGQTIFDYMDILKKEPNVTVVKSLRCKEFLDVVFKTGGAL